MQDQKDKDLTTSPSGRIYFEGLDGLRFLAFLAIFCFHAFATEDPEVVGSGSYDLLRGILTPTWLGVNFFFCLSGFLISYLLLVEKSRTGKIKLGNFYLRRILRIWPLYYAVMLFGFVVFPGLQQHFLGHVTEEPANTLYYLLFLANFDQIHNTFPYAPGLIVTWSLAVEEQFYLLWPLLLIIAPIKYMKELMVGVILVSLLFRLGPWAHEKHTLACLLDLGMGGLLAVLYHEGHSIIDRITHLSRKAIFGLYVLGVSITYLHLNMHIPLRIFIALFMGFIIAEQCFAKRSFYKMKDHRIITLMGTWTYGLYMLHPIALFVVKNLLEASPVVHMDRFVHYLVLRPVLAFLLSIALAYVSFYYFEKPFLRLKRRLKVVR